MTNEITNRTTKSNEYLYCYSARMKEFLVSDGHRYICVGVNEKAGTRFWLFEKDAKLSGSLDKYDALVK